MVPVLGKIHSLFVRDDPHSAHVNTQIHPEFLQVVEEKMQWIPSVKKDGSCGAIFSVQGQWNLYRRQDITKKSRNYQHVLEQGEMSIVAGHPCWITTLVRGTGKHEKEVPLYVFDVLPTGRPDPSALHIIGFTVVDSMEDKWAMSAVELHTDDPLNPYVWVSQFEGSLDVPVRKMGMKELVQKRGTELITVELMCRKFADHNGYCDDRCFVSPHGDEVIPLDKMPSSMTWEGIREWFQQDQTNRWADQEGFVILVPEKGIRFKVHRGHVQMESTWREKKVSGLSFFYPNSVE